MPVDLTDEEREMLAMLAEAEAELLLDVASDEKGKAARTLADDVRSLEALVARLRDE